MQLEYILRLVKPDTTIIVEEHNKNGYVKTFEITSNDKYLLNPIYKSAEVMFIGVFKGKLSIDIMVKDKPKAIVIPR